MSRNGLYAPFCLASSTQLHVEACYSVLQRLPAKSGLDLELNTIRLTQCPAQPSQTKLSEHEAAQLLPFQPLASLLSHPYQYLTSPCKGIPFP